ncbi:IDEAL domain-containing protein [Priestia megaterium]|uniref:IDEAL domain-containing protein n=1 Tax=Priestia megaterium TaxID=1404 RepID=UPI002E1AF3C6|nr:IDEAL domain-containing protein [Priestia megaterium]
MRVGFFIGDPIRYTLLGYEGTITSVVYPNDAEKNYLVVKVTKSDDPEIEVGSIQHISPERYEHVEFLPYDTCELYPSDFSDMNIYTSFLDKVAETKSRKFLIDQALEKGDKQLFMELTGGDAQ